MNDIANHERSSEPIVSRRSFFTLAGVSAGALAFKFAQQNTSAFAETGVTGAFSPLANTLDLLYNTAIHRDNNWGNTMLVRQTDAGGANHFMLCDGAGSVTGDALVAWLQSLGVNHLEVLYISHWHKDHVNAFWGKDGLIERGATAGISIGTCIFKPYDESFCEDSKYQAKYESVIRSCIKHNIRMLGPSLESAYGPSTQKKLNASSSSKASRLMVPFSAENTVFMLGEAKVKIYNWEVRDGDGNVLSGKDIIKRRRTILNQNFDSLGLLIEYNDRKTWIPSDIMNCRYDLFEALPNDDHDAGTGFEGDEHRLAPLIGPVDVMQLGHHCYEYANTDTYMQTLAPSLCTNTADATVAWYVADHIRERYAPVIEMCVHEAAGTYMIRYNAAHPNAAYGISADGNKEKYGLRKQACAKFIRDGSTIAEVRRYTPKAIQDMPELAQGMYSSKIGSELPVITDIPLGYAWKGWKAVGTPDDAPTQSWATENTPVTSNIEYEAEFVNLLDDAAQDDTTTSKSGAVIAAAGATVVGGACVAHLMYKKKHKEEQGAEERPEELEGPQKPEEPEEPAEPTELEEPEQDTIDEEQIEEDAES